MTGLLDLVAHWNVHAHSPKELGDADVVIAHEFGDQKVPSDTTKAIINTAVTLCARYNLPLICQFPGDQVACARGVNPLYVVRENIARPGTYLDTHEVHRQAALECAKYGWKKVILVSHRHHLWRAGENIKKRHHLMPLFPKETACIPYDPKCSRILLRQPLLFIPREIWSRWSYRKQGLI